MNCLIDKVPYAQICASKYLPVFSQPWWLDAVVGAENWEAIVVSQGNEVIAVWPLHFKKKSRFFAEIISQPRHTPYLGPQFFFPDGLSRKDQIKLEIEAVEAMLKQLRPHSYFSQVLHPAVANWLPFYWNGFKSVVSYTYILGDISNTELLLRGFSRNRKRLITKANQVLKVAEDLDVVRFYDFHSATLVATGSKILYSKQHLERMISASYQHGCGKTLYATDGDGNLRGAVFFVWDDRSAYYLISAVDTSRNDDGALTLLVWEAIKFLAGKTIAFDFEGSMTRSVEAVFRSFEAQQVPHFSLTKVNSKFLRTYLALKEVWL